MMFDGPGVNRYSCCLIYSVFLQTHVDDNKSLLLLLQFFVRAWRCLFVADPLMTNKDRNF